MKLIQLTCKQGNKTKQPSGIFAQIDDEDYEIISKMNWSEHKGATTSYAKTKIKQRSVLMHRLLLNVLDDPQVLIDHKDGNGLNNKKSNIRTSTFSDNSRNRRSQKNSTSKYLGVYIKTVKRKYKDKEYVYQFWAATIRIDNKNVSLGRFDTEEQAAIAYNKQAALHFGEFAKINPIP